jgi:hypothetical protein
VEILAAVLVDIPAGFLGVADPLHLVVMAVVVEALVGTSATVLVVQPLFLSTPNWSQSCTMYT